MRIETLVKVEPHFPQPDSEFPQPESEGRNGSTSNQNVRRSKTTPLRGRRTLAARRGANGGTARSAEAPSGNGTGRDVPTRSERVDDSDVSQVNAVNFAEIAASIPKDDLDRWARSLPREVLPGHTSSSHRYNCLCAACLEWRKTNGIPYGGPVKKEKKNAR